MRTFHPTLPPLSNFFTLLCAALVTSGAIAATGTLETIAVTPNAKTISVGQRQTYTATGSFSDRSQQVLGPAIGSLALGYHATCAALISGGAECWGGNQYGQLGDGTNIDSLVPRAVKGISNAAAVSVGYAHGCALLTSGAVKCWGQGGLGQLGNGAISDSTIPLSVTGIRTAIQVAASSFHSCAVLSSGAVKCWGYNLTGQLGNGTTGDYSSTPVTVRGIATAIAVAAEGLHTCALLASGAVRCWGWNREGQLGNGTNADSNVPVSVVGISTAIALAVGNETSCALLASGMVKCWGWNTYGQLGNGTRSDSSVPVAVTDISTAISITAGERHACAELRGGAAACWGWDEYGQLGDGTISFWSTVPVQVHALSAHTKVTAGALGTCALYRAGAVKCWGFGDNGELGNRIRTRSSVPVSMYGTPGVLWQSGDPSKASITERGVATGRAVGNTTITATTAGFINDNALLTIE